MFKVITPAHRRRKAALLCQILLKREGFYQPEEGCSLDPYDCDSTIYIAYEQKKLGVFGSARLNLCTDSPASAFYAGRFDKGFLDRAIEISLITFSMADDHWGHDHPGAFDHAIQRFYQGLKEVLTMLSIDRDFDHCLSLSFEEDHPDLSFFGNWRFYDQEKVTLDGSNFVVGNLSLIPAY